MNFGIEQSEKIGISFWVLGIGQVVRVIVNSN
ncbi:hypothetical protein KAOT1_00825 [Kordia algicida OT-1]|uniref:Uncharacterized protein n=1 Tax=Kordia algicida OT-1 TaxID=391587 RepID=A9EDJ1_9FLAO|nr:hypothetical protein KAOT1_00825 [Kordia algicida OT-1]